MSKEYRVTRFQGVERADSLTWNPHKLLGALLQCSTFHLKERVSWIIGILFKNSISILTKLPTISKFYIFVQGILHECNTMAAEYLFQSDKHYDIQYDTGDKVIQCGRHNDIFKFWLMWRAKVNLIINFEFEISAILRKRPDILWFSINISWISMISKQ